MTQIFKVISLGEPQTWQKQNGTEGHKRPITLQEFGAYKDDAMHACVLLGEAASTPLQPGDIVVARLHYTEHLHEGRTYQIIFIMAIKSLTPHTAVQRVKVLGRINSKTKNSKQ